jgi:AraC-like DNA-binding protein
MALSVRIVIDALERRGVDASGVLKAAHLSREALASPEHRVPYETAQQIWETAAALVKDEAFGVHVAEELAMGDYDIFDYIQAVSSTVGEGLHQLERYARLLYDHANFELIAEPLGARLVRRVANPAPQRDEFTLAWVLTRSRLFSGTHWLPDSLRFQHPSHGSDREVKRLFGCPFTFGAAETELRFPLTVLQLRHKHADSRLLAILLRYADGLLASHPRGEGLVAAACCAIARQLARGPPSLAATANAMHNPTRTLQRRLASKGLSHSRLVDRVRRDLALKHIGDARLSINEIAYLLQFGDAPSFHRAFRRWTGETPSDYRRRLHPALGKPKRARGN